MSKSRQPAMKFLLLVGMSACVACKTLAFDFLAYLDSAGSNDVTAVASRKSAGYVRIQLADGSFLPESYVFGKGGAWRGRMADATIDKLRFLDVAHMIAGPLASQNFIPSEEPDATKLLIMVYWGTSHGQEEPADTNGYQNLQKSDAAVDRAQMEVHVHPSPQNYRLLHQAQDEMMTTMGAVAAENKMRDQDDLLSVNMLGYGSWWEDTQQYEGTPMGYMRQDLIDEIEEDRYFVVLLAYDFQLMRKQKKNRLLWETRFSIRERRHALNEDLTAMAQSASQFFGQDSHGLIHKAIPLGRVDIGDVRSLGEVPDRQNTHTGEPPSKP